MLPPGNVNATAEPTRLLLLLVQIRLQIFLPAANRGHETHTVSLGDRARPTFQLDKTPVRKIRNLAGLGIGFGREKKKLHPFFDQPDLGHPANPSVLKDRSAEGFEIRKLSRDVVMFEP